YVHRPILANCLAYTLGYALLFFFFQAEDGIRDFHVTGVQTCALPISLAVAGGLIAREFYQEREPVRAQAPVAVPSSTSLAPSEQPGPAEVKLTPDAARHPYGETVRALLEAYTTGINERNYERWKSAVSQERIAVQP